MRTYFKPVLLRLYRAGVLVVIAWLIHDQHRWFMAQTEGALDVSGVRDFFPAAASLGARDPDTAIQRVLDSSGETLGLVTQTTPLSDKILGYSGPTNTLIACDAQGRIIGLRVLGSGDTPEHLAEVIRHRAFFNAFKGAKLGDPASHPKVDGVSGATLTSTAIAEGVLRRLGQEGASLRFPEPITLEEVKAVMPEAATVRSVPGKPGMLAVLDANGTQIAQATRTSPSSDTIVGYKGPSDMLIVLDADGVKIIGIRLRKSYDTREYVGYVTDDRYFMNLFNGMTLEQLGKLDFAQAKVEGVSGATETSWAVAEGLKRRAQVLSTAPPKGNWLSIFTLKAADWGLLGVLAFSLVMTFTSLRGQRWARWLQYGLLIGYAGLYCGALLSQAMFAGWALHGIPWKTAPVLVLLTAFALALPMFTRRQFYCHHYCPHGALQQVLAHRVKWQIHVPHKLGLWLEKVPWLLLIFVVVAVMLRWNVNLNALEAFDAWLIRLGGTANGHQTNIVMLAGWATIALAVAGLVASLFVPMAYCRYGCPTGAMLKFLRYAGHGDFFNKRDAAAALLVIGVVAMRLAVR
jgi:NosR/NirI family transcriptional regulator, nitrous oxide reductase regulator